MDSMLVVGMAFAVLALLVLMIRRYPLGARGGGDVGGAGSVIALRRQQPQRRGEDRRRGVLVARSSGAGGRYIGTHGYRLGLNN